MGSGEETSIADLADLVRQIVYPEATIVYDDSRPDGMPRKVLDISRLNQLGWWASTPLRAGIAETYAWFRDHRSDERHSIRI